MVAVYVDFENLVNGAGRRLPQRPNPVPYAALVQLSRDYGTAVIRRAYADWGNPQFGRYQHDLATHGVDLIQVVRFGSVRKNAADIRMAVDAMETLIAHPDVGVFVLVTGDGDYTPLVQRLQEFGKYVVGVGAEVNTSPRLAAVCCRYTYWDTLLDRVDSAIGQTPTAQRTPDTTNQHTCDPTGVGNDAKPHTPPMRLDAAATLLVTVMRQATGTPTAAWVKNRMLTLAPSFDERDYGCTGFRGFLARLDHLVTVVGTSGSDITLALTRNHARS
ncbi:MAG: NYN domain-containing protein [Saccharothrix sp.]|nr:NYN domain-containing protein [Saccharothrix sp.]